MSIHRNPAIIAAHRLLRSADRDVLREGGPQYRDEWNRGDYELWRRAIGQRLVRLSHKFAGLRRTALGLRRAAFGYRRRLLGSEGAAAQGGAAASGARSAPVVRSQLTQGLVIEARAPARAIMVPLNDTGVFLLVEANDGVVRSIPADVVGSAVEEAAFAALRAGEGNDVGHWTTFLRSPKALAAGPEGPLALPGALERRM